MNFTKLICISLLLFVLSCNSNKSEEEMKEFMDKWMKNME